MTEAMRKLVGMISDARSKLKRTEGLALADVGSTLDAALERLQRSLRRSPVVLVAGEANSGKTSVANMLAGFDVLPSAVIANTAVPVHLKHGAASSITAVTRRGRVPLAALSISEPLPKFLYSGLQRIEVELPSMRNSGYEILDTPGSHGKVDLSERADVLLWCSVAARPWTESERRTVSELPARLRARSLLAITHKDTLSPADCDRVLARYQDMAGPLFSKIVMIDASAGNFAISGPLGQPGAIRSEQGQADELAVSLDEIIGRFWDHRAMTGRRLCRHVARALKPVLPVPPINSGTSATTDPVATVISNIAGRLATV